MKIDWLKYKIPLSRWFLIFLVSLAWFAGYAAHAALPTDPAQRVAQKALAGEFGELQDWQEKGYSLLLTVTPTCKLAWITNYWPGEPGVNHTTASGRRVSSRVAAMLDQPWGTWVLIDLPDGYELRQVFDTGSRQNRHRAQHPEAYGSNRKPAEVWLDRCLLRRPPTKALRVLSWVRSIYVF